MEANQPSAASGHETGAMGARVGSSMAWMLGTGIFLKFLSFVAQIVMGWYLSDEDFGVFAISLAIVGVCTFLREGGGRDYLIQQGPSKYAKLSGPIFWMAMTITAALALWLVAASLLIGRVSHLLPESFRDPRMPGLLALGAVILCLSTPASISSAKLQSELRFSVMGKIQIVSGLIRYSSLITLAVLGAGPYSFPLSWIAVACFEMVAYQRAAGVRLFREPARPELWIGFLSVTSWLIVGFFANFLNEMGSSAAVGIFCSQSDVGYYYFAFSLAVQLVLLLSVNAAQVLMPVLARLNHDPVRQGQAVLRSTSAVMLIASGLSVGFAICADPVMTLIWHRRWEPAVLPVQIFCIMFPLRMTYSLTLAVLQAKGQFKRWACVSVVESTILFAAAMVGGWYAHGAEWPALFVGVGVVFTRSWITGNVLKESGVQLGKRLQSLFGAWAFSLLAAVITWTADHRLIAPAGWERARLWIMDRSGLSPALAGSATEMLHGGLMFAVFISAYFLFIRLFMSSALSDVVTLMPPRVRSILARVSRRFAGAGAEPDDSGRTRV